MTTFATMKARIADELARSDLTTQIATAVTSAIKHYERRRFWFNETTGSVTVSAGAEFYGSADAAFLASLVQIDTARLALGSTYFQLRHEAWSVIDELASGTGVTGTPSHYSYYGQQLRLWPKPNASATLRLAYVMRPADPATDTESSVWTLPAFGEELIRTRAKVDLFENVIRDPGEADRLRVREQEILHALTRETGAKAASGRIVASYL